MYLVPHPGDDKNPQANPEWVARVKASSPAYVVVLPQNQLLNMGPTLGKNFAYLLLRGFLVAYVAASALLGHSVGAFPKAIFWGWTRSAVAKEFLDGLVYALVTAGVFGWLWPS